jgi:general secretion pathway protein E
MALNEVQKSFVGMPLDKILVELFKLNEETINKAHLLIRDKSFSISEALLDLKAITSLQLAQAIAMQADLPFKAEINADQVPDDAISIIPISYAKQKKILPIEKSEEGYVIVCVDPYDFATIDELKLKTGLDIKTEVSSPEIILGAINNVYDRTLRQAETAVAELEEETSVKGGLEEEVVDLLEMEGDEEAPIIRLVNSLMSQSVKDRASDIHVEPFEKELMVRFRIDGILYEIIKPPKRFQNSIVSRIKIMAGLNIAEKRLPQDGRIRLKVAGKDIDIRVSTVPTTYGERIVMRLLDRSSVMKDLADIGFNQQNLTIMNQLITASHGIILVTGPTGSGKTSTLYACLSKINKPDLNILTIEDPVEYQLKGVGQVQVNSKIELTFAAGLRSFLRQDPDVIMVGEIRDRETAEIAIQASLTGHLVLSTLHTNDAPGAVTRLVDMHVEPFLVASSLLAVVAQRLVRTICPNCKESYKPAEEELSELGLSSKDVKQLWRGKGCDNCQNTGYVGRLGIFEMMLLDDDLRKLIMKNEDASTIKAKAREKGMKTLREDGADKVVQGITTAEEVTRVTQEEAIIIEG